MRSATFWVIHPPSKSRAMVEYGLIDKKVKLMGIFFTHGNVVDIATIRKTRDQAKLIFADSWQTPPFIG